jgi:hypothetical protein
MAGDDAGEALVSGLIPELEARATGEALALLLAMSSVAQRPVGPAASAAADRLVEIGVVRPRWAAELSSNVTAGECLRLQGADGTASVLGCMFRRAGRSHNIVITVDDLDCGAARSTCSPGRCTTPMNPSTWLIWRSPTARAIRRWLNSYGRG